jgi:glycerol-3-phosphate dehydrogenase
MDMSAPFDKTEIAIIGAGVVGCALFRRFAIAGLKPLMIEAGKDILSGASKANSAMLHTGYDAPTGSLELACVRAGYREYLEIRERLNLPLLQTGGIMVAWNEADLAKMPAIADHARANGVSDIQAIDRAELRRREPNLGENALGGLVIPGEHIIDPWSAPLAYALQGIAHGGRTLRGVRVEGGEFDGNCWRLATTRGVIEAGLVVNAAGNYGDIVEAIDRPSPFTITPRKGQFVVFDKPAHRMITASILPVPSERTKGVMMCRTAFGNLLVGPTAEDQQERDIAETDKETCEKLVARGIEMLPALQGVGITAIYAGLRPATQFKDYQIECRKERRWITVAGIRSTGLTGALGIATHVMGLFAESFGAIEESEPIWVQAPNLAELGARPYHGEAGGDIVCHCEAVTRSEIEAALCGPLPADDLSGLKRRTRAMMGRCQGFYCGASIRAIAMKTIGP